MKQIVATTVSAASLVLASGLAWTAGQYGPGVSDTEIKIVRRQSALEPKRVEARALNSGKPRQNPTQAN